MGPFPYLLEIILFHPNQNENLIEKYFIQRYIYLVKVRSLHSTLLPLHPIRPTPSILILLCSLNINVRRPSLLLAILRGHVRREEPFLRQSITV